MSHLGMVHAMYQPTVNHAAAADSGAHCKIYEGIQSPGCSPCILTQRSSIDIGIKQYRVP